MSIHLTCQYSITLRKLRWLVALLGIGETPHMIRAAVKGIAHLTYEFTDLYPRLSLFFHPRFSFSRERTKQLIKPIYDGNGGGPAELVRLLLEMLVKKCGLEAVKEMKPLNGCSGSEDAACFEQNQGRHGKVLLRRQKEVYPSLGQLPKLKIRQDPWRRSYYILNYSILERSDMVEEAMQR
ncbi:hypothetical protein Tco_0959563, partial [Tanacetum coccineum]